jgi:hypothetical protein
VFTNLTFISRMWAFPAHARGGLYGRLRRPRLHSVIKLCKHNFAALVLHAILGAIAGAYACRSPPRTKPRYASLVPKGSLSLTWMLPAERN